MDFTVLDYLNSFYSRSRWIDILAKKSLFFQVAFNRTALTKAKSCIGLKEKIGSKNKQIF